MLYVLLLVLCMRCSGEKLSKVDIYPGFGWDHLRFSDLAPIYDVSNFNDSHAFQACIEMIPIHENLVQMGSVEIDTFNSKTTEYSSNTMIGGSASFLGFKISGSYSKEYQSTRKQQGEEKTITLRNQIDYLMVDVILLSTCPLRHEVKNDLIEIAKYQANNETRLATYFAQLFVKKYGTHYTSRLHLGGSIMEEDFISYSSYYASTEQKSNYKAAAESAFLGSFGISASYSSSSNQSQLTIDSYKKKITRKVINSKGGDVFILGTHMDTWHKTVRDNPAIIRRAIENVTYSIQTEQVPELTVYALAKVRKEINEAINAYIEMNTIRGCMDRNSPSFNWAANIDDNSCATVQQTTQFGGFIRTCFEDSHVTQICSSLERRNYYTNSLECKSEFVKRLLHASTESEPLYRRKCWSCGFLWMSKCCKDEYIGTRTRYLNLYICSRNISQQLGSQAAVDIQRTYLFGGSYTTTKVNPVTNTYGCPEDFYPASIDGYITVCLKERLVLAMSSLPRYGGIYSCQQGNIATTSNIRGCPDGYSSYAMGTMAGNCFLEVCLKFEKFDHIQTLPPIALPPFFSIESLYLSVDTETNTNNSTTD